MQINRFIMRPFVEQALREEIGPGDTTGGFLVDPSLVGTALIYAKKPGVICGLPLAEETIRMLDPDAEVIYESEDGDEVKPGQVLLQVTASAASLFATERSMLDWIQYLSAIATRTRHFANLVKPFGTRLTDTRKGVPGMRVLQKYAVRKGGAHNHLFGLHNCILVKDNHIAMAGSLTRAVEILRDRAQHTFKIEVECETLEQVQEALDVGADIIMFDNMDLGTMSQGLSMVNKRVPVEASGGINEQTIVPIAQLGVDIISVGEITHTVKALDVSMDIGEIKASARRQIEQERISASG